MLPCIAVTLLPLHPASSLFHPPVGNAAIEIQPLKSIHWNQSLLQPLKSITIAVYHPSLLQSTIHHYCSLLTAVYQLLDWPYVHIHTHRRAHKQIQHVYRHLFCTVMEWVDGGQDWACKCNVFYSHQCMKCVCCRTHLATLSMLAKELWWHPIQERDSWQLHIAHAHWQTGHKRDSWYGRPFVWWPNFVHELNSCKLADGGDPCEGGDPCGLCKAMMVSLLQPNHECLSFHPALETIPTQPGYFCCISAKAEKFQTHHKPFYDVKQMDVTFARHLTVS